MPPTVAETRQEEARKLLRLFLNDTPELNRLILREESDAAKLDLALRLAIDDYNITAPILTPVTIANYPSLWLLLYGGAIQTLRSNGLLQSRNELVYSSGGVSVRIFDKTQLYQSWIAQFFAEYEMKKKHFKISMNVTNAMLAQVGVHSEYESLAHYW
jgi:hypothetical protein